MSKNKGLWRLSMPLLILMGLCVLIYVGHFIFVWGHALSGDTIEVFHLMDMDIEEPLTPDQYLFGMFSMGLMIAGLAFVFISAYRFFRKISMAGFFADGVAKAMRNMGIGLAMFWFGISLFDNFYPAILTRHLPDHMREPVQWFPFDDTIMLLLIAFVFIVTSQALREARAIDQDNKQII